MHDTGTRPILGVVPSPESAHNVAQTQSGSVEIEAKWRRKQTSLVAVDGATRNRTPSQPLSETSFSTVSFLSDTILDRVPLNDVPGKS